MSRSSGSTHASESTYWSFPRLASDLRRLLVQAHALLSFIPPNEIITLAEVVHTAEASLADEQSTPVSDNYELELRPLKARRTAATAAANAAPQPTPKAPDKHRWPPRKPRQPEMPPPLHLLPGHSRPTQPHLRRHDDRIRHLLCGYDDGEMTEREPYDDEPWDDMQADL